MTRHSLVSNGISIENSKVIYTGIDIESFIGSTPLTYKDANVLIVFVGRLTPEKGIETAIKAVRKLILEMGRDDIKFSIAGTGPKEYEVSLKQMAHQDGLSSRILFLGHLSVADIRSLYQKSDILLVPSEWQEPFSRVILEGMASGLATISTPCGGTSEAILDEENGLLFAPGDSSDLAGKIERLILDPALRHKLAKHGRNTVAERFSEVKMLDQIETYLSEIMNG